MPDIAIFADTQSEPKEVYDHLEWLMSPNVLPFPVRIVTAGSLRDEIIDAGEGRPNKYGRAPFFVKNEDGSSGMINRQCTQDYKIEPILKEVRSILGLKPRQWWPKEQVVEQWIGISTDEASRMKPSRIGAIENRWPLIEKRMTRWDCLLWLERNGYPRPPKSACTFCPFRTDMEWRRMRDEQPDAFADAIQVDQRLRQQDRPLRVIKGKLFVHRSLTPLEDVDLSSVEDRGQLNLFNNECEGMCGV